MDGYKEYMNGQEHTIHLIVDMVNRNLKKQMPAEEIIYILSDKERLRKAIMESDTDFFTSFSERQNE